MNVPPQDPNPSLSKLAVKKRPKDIGVLDEDQYHNDRQQQSTLIGPSSDSFPSSALVHTATKDFHKQAKIVKSFECQKIVKKIKAMKEKISQAHEATSNQDHTDTRNRQLLKLDEKLTWTKAFPLDTVVQECLRRLGLWHSSTTDSSTLSNQTHTEFYQSLLENMLGHKRLKDALEKWNQKYTDSRIRLSHNHMNRSKTNATINQPRREKRQRDHIHEKLVPEPGTHLFVDSLSGLAQDTDHDMDGMEYHEDADIFQPKKKNRMGQKQRKAKAMAMEAKKTGKTWNQSLNWRSKKSGDSKPCEEISSSGLSKGSTILVGDVANMGTTWKEEGKAHPSWAAREALKAKSGILPFAGKKITFD